MLDYEIKARAEGFQYVIGVDEAGRGPLAGPVVASAVALQTHEFQNTISDSKKLTPKKRELSFKEIYDNAYVGVGIINEIIIDELNILQATYLAMNHAIESCIKRIVEETQAECFASDVLVVIDGNQFKTTLPYRYETVVKGDSKICSIACASIVAKVTRDRILDAYDQVLPEYGFAKHKGYGTKAHRAAIKEHGPSFIHRRSFSGC